MLGCRGAVGSGHCAAIASVLGLQVSQRCSSYISMYNLYLLLFNIVKDPDVERSELNVSGYTDEAPMLR